MIKIEHNVSLKEWNTFGVSAFAKAYTKINSLQQLKEAVGYYSKDNIFLLGGGSNILITRDINKTVLHLCLKGITTENKENGRVLVTANAGENWHEFVQFCISQNLAGLENLSLIPGNVGTAPIQNIGAYGVEIKDVFHSCDVLNIETLEVLSFTREQCKFGYRDSIFKNEARGKYIITSVTFELQDLISNPDYKLKTSYGAIQEELKNLEGELTISKVSQAVINIRNSKLPNPKEIGNGGSFFKNPIITKEQYNNLFRMHPAMPSYPVNDQLVKVPAGWLIEQSDMKGKRWGDAGVHDRQALVLVNHGNATGEEIITVARKVQEAVNLRFGIEIEMEVNII